MSDADTPHQLLVVFIHGFKGTDTTFGPFPQRLQHVLTETIPNTTVDCIVFPAYETKGELDQAVIRFADWLTKLVLEKEVASGGGAGSTKVVLCGHSMGGLLAADTVLQFVSTKPDTEAPLWPNIVACLAFDTPYLGLHPYVFKNSATKAFEHANNFKNAVTGAWGAISAFSPKKDEVPTIDVNKALPAPPTTEAVGWAKWAPAAYAVGGALFAGAAAGAAYWKRDDLGAGYGWATDHMKYVGNLWDEEALKQRMDALVQMDETLGVQFRTFYTLLPPTPPVHLLPRTFVVLPQQGSPAAAKFFSSKNELALDEIQAHTGMFDAKTNDGYFELGLETARVIREAVLAGKTSLKIQGGEERLEQVAVEQLVEEPKKEQ